MDLNELKSTIKSYYKVNNLHTWLGDDQFVMAIPPQVWDGMVERNSTVVPEVKKLNSSTALAVNYFQLLGECLKVSIDYEMPVCVPLILPPGKGHNAMMDATYACNGVKYYVECKFLEPYYSSTHEISASYFIEKFYENYEVASKWIGEFKEIQRKIVYGEFKYFDINQMYKHLLAIYRTEPQDAVVVLRNLIWRPTDKFIDAIKCNRNRSFLIKRIKKLKEEMIEAQTMMNKFVGNTLKWRNCKIEIEFYNNELEAIKKHKLYGKFAEKYMLD